MTQQPDHEEREILKGSGPGAGQIEVGMEVTSLDGERIGRVKEVRGAEFLVDRPLARDLWVLFGAVLATQDYSGNVRGPVQPTAVVLNVSAAHVNARLAPFVNDRPNAALAERACGRPCKASCERHAGVTAASRRASPGQRRHGGVMRASRGRHGSVTPGFTRNCATGRCHRGRTAASPGKASLQRHLGRHVSVMAGVT